MMVLLEFDEEVRTLHLQIDRESTRVKRYIRQLAFAHKAKTAAIFAARAGRDLMELYGIRL